MQAPDNLQQPPAGHATQEWLQQMAQWQGQVRQTLPWLGRSASLAAAGTSVAREVVDLVRGMHGTISQVAPPWGEAPEGQTRGITRLVYDCVDTGFTGVQKVFATLAQHLPATEDAPGTWLQVQAAINGVLGDRLERDGNALAIPTQLLPLPQPGRHCVIFLHGLCMSELGWQSPAHQDLCTRLQQAGFRVAYLRYNSGRRIAQNGADLARLLEQLVEQGETDQISLIGHSMGGLVARSAMDQAAASRWLERIHSVAYLGSPHHGAPLERLGNHANRLLKVSPYTAPFMRLGNIRSAGIQDLRYGCVGTEDWENCPSTDAVEDFRRPRPLPPHGRHWLVAASRSPELPAELHQAQDDYLVPVPSALGLHADPQHTLEHPRLQRRTLAATHHLALLNGAATSELIAEVLLGPPAH